MERYTKYIDNERWYNLDSFKTSDWNQEAIEQLGNYEDIGLTAEEIKQNEILLTEFFTWSNDKNGCSLSGHKAETFGNCSKGCYKCIIDALKELEEGE